MNLHGLTVGRALLEKKSVLFCSNKVDGEGKWGSMCAPGHSSVTI